MSQNDFGGAGGALIEVVGDDEGNPRYLGRSFVLDLAKAQDGRGYCIGRASAAELRFGFEALGRCCIFVRHDGGSWIVDDSGSANPILVNGQPAQHVDGRRGTVLAHGDRLSFDHAPLVLELRTR